MFVGPGILIKGDRDVRVVQRWDNLVYIGLVYAQIAKIALKFKVQKYSVFSKKSTKRIKWRQEVNQPTTKTPRRCIAGGVSSRNAKLWKIEFWLIFRQHLRTARNREQPARYGGFSGEDLPRLLAHSCSIDRKLNLPKFIRYHTQIVQISCGFEHSLLRTNDGKLYSMGNNKFGQLGIGSNVSNLKSFFVEE